MNLLTHRSPTAIALCLLGGSAFLAPTAFAAPIDTYAKFLTLDEIEQFTSVDFDEEGGEGGRSFGTANFHSAIFERLLDVTGTKLTAEEQGMMQYLRSVPVTKISGTTDVHVDRHHDSGEPVEGKAAFIVLNDNAHARFVHGSTDVHAEAGDLVVFDADVPHNTQVARGTLSLVGPVDLRRLTPVGDKTVAPTGSKGAKSPKSPKAPKAPKSSKGSKGAELPAEPAVPSCMGFGRMRDLGDRELTLQYMTDRFKEEGSVRSFVDSLGYEVDLNSGTGEKDNALSKEDCEGLMSLVKEDLFSSVDELVAQDIQQHIDESDLVSVIGKDKFNALLDLHKEVVGAAIPLETIVIRHMHGAANSDAFLEYHTDEFANAHSTYSTIIVALNDNSSVKEGGDLYYLREDGPVLASRAQGKAFAHSFNVLHGVSPHVGDRVSLMLHFNHDLKMENVGGRKLTEETKRKLGSKRFVL